MDDFVALGVDPASSKIAFVAISNTNEFLVAYYPKIGKSGGPACSQAWHITALMVARIHATFGTANVHAFIEAPVVGRGGVRSTIVQCFTSGAIQGALHDAGCTTQVANVSSWKKRVVGKGNATKGEVSEHLRLRRPALFAEAGGNQDLIDASCIAIYGQQILRGRMGWDGIMQGDDA